MADKKRDILEFVEQSNFEQFTPTHKIYPNLLMFQLVREVQYGIVCLFKSVPPEMMDNNQLLRKSNHCKIVFMDFEVASLLK